MYCDHCYRDAGAKVNDELSTEEGKNLIEEIAKAGFRIMIFSGGEPLMRKDIFQLVAHAKALGLRPVFGTNGSLITLQVAQKLKDLGVMGMGISLDSLSPRKHNQLRKHDSAWESAVDGMKNCKQAGLPFQIHTTVMGWNDPEIEALTDFAVRVGAVAHHIFFMVPTGRAVNIEADSLQPQEYEALLRRIMQKQREVDIELKPTCAPQFMRIADEMDQSVRFHRGCLAGTSYCIISPTGNVQACAYLDVAIGNVRELPFSEIWKNNEVLQTLRTMEYGGSCGSCRYKVKCGGCRARAAFYHDGDYMAEDSWCVYGLESREAHHG